MGGNLVPALCFSLPGITCRNDGDDISATFAFQKRPEREVGKKMGWQKDEKLQFIFSPQHLFALEDNSME